MRVFLIVINISLIFWCSIAIAQSPPFATVTIKGETETKFNKVSLFESGSSNEPFKTSYISDNGQYSIDVEISRDMRKKDDYLFTDIRFWGDKNNNNIKDSGEPTIECHFIIWVPSDNIVYMQVYEGPTYPFKSSVLNYNYKNK